MGRRLSVGQRICPTLTLNAQRLTGDTNPTGKLRLTKSVFSIDHVTYFRQVLFYDETWTVEVRKGNKSYELAQVDFDVEIDGKDLGTHTLMIDYALHRVAGQANVSTVLAWGHQLGQLLASKSHAGDWVVIERFAGPRYRLSIEKKRPGWA